jgi:hypothetical protein
VINWGPFSSCAVDGSNLKRISQSGGNEILFTGKHCRNGHIAERYIGYSGTCIECSRARDAQRRLDTKKSREALPGVQARAAARDAGSFEYSTGVPCVKGHASPRFVSDGRCIACYREKKKKWKSKNTAKVAANRRARELRKVKATPLWLTPEHRSQIEALYLHAQVWTEVTGVPYHVDHIIPLKGKNVCGLHVPWNLRVITGEANMRKSNKVEVL